MGLSIRLAGPDDAAVIAAIYAPYVIETAITFEETPPAPQVFRERMASAASTHPWIVACRGEDVLGYAYCSRHRERASYRWSVDVSVYLDRAWHRRGIGRALYTTLLHALEELGYARAYAGITLPNASSVALHEAMGFHSIGIYEGVGYKLGAWRDVGWWGRPLAGHADEPNEPLTLAELSASGQWQACLEHGARYLRE